VIPAAGWAGALPGPVTYRSVPQAVYDRESLAQTLRQLETYGRDGLPVISGDGRRALGWITNRSVLQAVAREIGSAPPSGQAEPSTPLGGYQVMEVTIEPGSAAEGAVLRSVGWPAGILPVSVLRRRSLQPPDPDLVLAAGDRISLLARGAGEPEPGHNGTRPREIVP
jgi:CIC family chloride channel protein